MNKMEENNETFKEFTELTFEKSLLKNYIDLKTDVMKSLKIQQIDNSII